MDFGASYGSQLPHMDLQFCLGRILHFGQSHPPTPPHLSLVTHFVKSAMLVHRGVMLQYDKYILSNYEIKDAKGHLWVCNRKIGDVGVLQHDVTFPHFA